MLCYVGKATKIFFFLVVTLTVAGLFLGLGLHHRWAHKARPVSPPCPAGCCGTGPCSTINSFPDPAAAAAVPPPYFPVGPSDGVPQPPSPVGPTSISAPPPPVLNNLPVADPAGSVPPVGPTSSMAPPPILLNPPVADPVLVPPAASVAAPPPVTAPLVPNSGAFSPRQN